MPCSAVRPSPMIQAQSIPASTAYLRRRSDLSRLTTERLSKLLEEYVRQTGASVDLHHLISLTTNQTTHDLFDSRS